MCSFPRRRTASTSPSGTAVITGTISYLSRIALDPKAVIDVQLQDVSQADAPAKTIASQSIDANGQQVPIAFTLPYDPAVINAKNRYALAVRISVDGQLRFVNTTAIPVLTNGARSTNLEVLVDPVSGVASAGAVTPTLTTLTGTLTYTPSATLPAGTILDVQINDTTVVTSPVIVAAAQSAVTKPIGGVIVRAQLRSRLDRSQAHLRSQRAPVGRWSRHLCHTHGRGCVDLWWTLHEYPARRRSSG